MAFVRSHTVDIAAPADVVYDYVGDLMRHGEWGFNGLTVTHTGGPAGGPGAQYACRVGQPLPGAKKAVHSTVEVVAAQRPRLFVYDCKDAGGRYRWTFALEDVDGVTRVTHTVQRMSAPFYVPLVQPALWRVVGWRQVQGGLDTLKRLAEKEAAGAHRSAGDPQPS